jgi:hypothetical protein
MPAQTQAAGHRLERSNQLQPFRISRCRAAVAENGRQHLLRRPEKIAEPGLVSSGPPRYLQFYLRFYITLILGFPSY